ncbi:MAG: hypothetical protein ABS79_01080 [Planctomycetes bacterium SCN 63-9]|nr:MAG: hypothetical protein ABS79_01080 [Planctomycetes bacterium SCN 63-9]
MYHDGVTIAIPNWNHEFFLARSIRSGLDAIRHLGEQGIAGEVLIVDDLSRDGSRPLLRQFEARYFDDGLRVFQNPTNQGPGGSRNVAIAQARYRHIVFLDADNQLVAKNIPLFHRSIKETDATAVYGNLLVRKVLRSGADSASSNEGFSRRMFESNYIDTLAMYDRSHLTDLVGFDATLPGLEDWEMWLHLASNGCRLVFVPLVFGFYDFLPYSTNVSVNNADRLMARAKRIYDQVDFRKHAHVNAQGLRYFPGVGYI